jgi:hypothetical protein
MTKRLFSISSFDGLAARSRSAVQVSSALNATSTEMLRRPCESQSLKKNGTRERTIERRGFLTALGAAGAGSLIPGTAHAVYQCTPDWRCVAEVPEDQLQLHYAIQQRTEWCWAASISMLFSCYGYEVSQERIVDEAYGSPVNMPAQSITMSLEMNRDWTDDGGKRFSSRVLRAFDFNAGVQTINNPFIIGQLERSHPLVIGANRHAVLLTRLEYIGGSMNPTILGGGVLDPWPGEGARRLRSDELHPIYNGGSLYYVVAIEVTGD